MSAFALSVNCPNCSGPFLLVNAHSNGLLSVAILECPACEREWEVTARIVPHGPSRAAAARVQAVKRAGKARAREKVPA